MASELYSEMKPYIDLCKKMGMLLSQLAKGQVSKVDITYYGDLLEVDTWLMSSSCLEGLFARGFMENVNLLNALSTAEKLGVKVHEIKSSEEHDYKNCIELKLHTDKGNIDALGTVFGRKDSRVVRLMDYELDFVPEGPMLALGNKDVPGVVGKVGMVLGNRNINIAQMALARKKSGHAIIVLNTDNLADKGTLDELKSLDEIEWAVGIELK
jgi:D-3-phosphoglycerate dehydrogenase